MKMLAVVIGLIDGSDAGGSAVSGFVLPPMEDGLAQRVDEGIRNAAKDLQDQCVEEGAGFHRLAKVGIRQIPVDEPPA